MLNSLLLIVLLIALSAFFSLSEISLAASRKIKLKQMADEGNLNAAMVLKLQETPGIFFTVIQIGIRCCRHKMKTQRIVYLTPKLWSKFTHNHTGMMRDLIKSKV